MIYSLYISFLYVKCKSYILIWNLTQNYNPITKILRISRKVFYNHNLCVSISIHHKNISNKFVKFLKQFKKYSILCTNNLTEIYG